MTRGLIIPPPPLCFFSLQPGKLTEAFKYFIQGMGYSKYSRHAVFFIFGDMHFSGMLRLNLPQTPDNFLQDPAKDESSATLWREEVLWPRSS